MYCIPVVDNYNNHETKVCLLNVMSASAANVHMDRNNYNPHEDISLMQKQLAVARNEISNLRQQVKTLGHVYQKDVQSIRMYLNSWHCSKCKVESESPKKENSDHKTVSIEEKVPLQPIGLVSSWFPEKRATPRQPTVCQESLGKLTLFNSIFTNPEHSLEGLECFSHMWILFYFHKNNATHIRAKVAPPRLNGSRIGVFGTRSPNRPAPIGLSLVKIEKVEGASVYFSGVDVVDGTPVFDIKPYIPQYDTPQCSEVLTTTSVSEMGNINPTAGCVDKCISGISNLGLDVSSASAFGMHSPVACLSPEKKIGEREAPDGEEGADISAGAVKRLLSPCPKNVCAAVTPEQSSGDACGVKVPAWVIDPPAGKLEVKFSDRALHQIQELVRLSPSSNDFLSIAGEADAISAIKSVLQEDPRSVYLRQKWRNQFYTFLIHSFHVTCKFDDGAHTVSVLQVDSAQKLCSCGELEWKCTQHNENG